MQRLAESVLFKTVVVKSNPYGRVLALQLGLAFAIACITACSASELTRCTNHSSFSPWFPAQNLLKWHTSFQCGHLARIPSDLSCSTCRMSAAPSWQLRIERRALSAFGWGTHTQCVTHALVCNAHVPHPAYEYLSADGVPSTQQQHSTNCRAGAPHNASIKGTNRHQLP